MSDTKKSSPSLWSLTQQQAGELLGKSTRWVRDSAAPRDEDGSYDGRQLVAWLLDQQEPDALKEQKLKEEISVLEERKRKLQYENEVTAGNMADIRLMRESLIGLTVPLRKLGELLGRKVNISGVDAQQMLNQAIMDYERLAREKLGHESDSS